MSAPVATGTENLLRILADSDLSLNIADARENEVIDVSDIDAYGNGTLIYDINSLPSNHRQLPNLPKLASNNPEGIRRALRLLLRKPEQIDEAIVLWQQSIPL